jgi:hypothetical protein
MKIRPAILSKFNKNPSSYSLVIKCSSEDVHEKNAHRADPVCLSVCMIQLDNRWILCVMQNKNLSAAGNKRGFELTRIRSHGRMHKNPVFLP